MNIKSLCKGVLLVALSAMLIAVITMVGIFSFVAYSNSSGRGWGVPIREISDALEHTPDGYRFTGTDLLGADRWAMLLDRQGRVVWSLRRPDDVPTSYTVPEAATFARWYLGDYPVQCWARTDGLFVVGAPKGSVWKHDMAMSIDTLVQMPLWFLAFFLLALVCVLGLAWLVLRRWFRQAQQVRDAARSDWINGVSHDIRTPLSVVMGYAAQLEQAPGLSPTQKQQAGAIRVQSQMIRDLVGDLNLTMRLDCAMQALRCEALQPTAFLRQVVADFLNGGMAAGFSLEMDLPQAPLPVIRADPFLLRRALGNLLTNCVRHNPSGCAITVGGRAQGSRIVLWVEGGRGTDTTSAGSRGQLAPDGGAAHGTGLRLVAQIAAAHGGQAVFSAGPPFRCEIRLPAAL